MILNLLILIFIAIMGYWWSRQGLFSAFLHLLVTIAAGALALAVWEPLVFAWLLGRMPDYAWGVGLLAPLVLFLIVIRTVMDKLIRGNLYFSPIVDRIGGGLFGALAGVLLSGLAVIGIGFVSLPSDLMGYEPYVVDTNGDVIDNPAGGTLWFAVDRRAAGFYGLLSGGAFYDGTPLALYQPDLPRQASLFRMRYDGDASVAASPAAVTLGDAGAFPAPLQSVDDGVMKLLGDPGRRVGNKIIIVDTKWTAVSGTFDSDSVARVFPTQVRLLTAATGPSGAPDTELEMVAPLGVVRMENGSATRVYLSLQDARTFPWADQRGATFGWVFAMPVDRTPRAIFIRHLRFDLPELKTEPAAAIVMLGQLPPEPTAATAPAPGSGTPAAGTPAATGTPAVTPGAQSGVNPGAGASLLEVTNAMPIFISMNLGSALTYEGTQIKSGQATVPPASGAVPAAVRADKIYVFPSQSCVRMTIEAQKAQSLLGATRVAAASLGGISIEDTTGTVYLPIGYVWVKGTVQEININRDAPIQSSRELPIRSMGPADKLYLYFALPHNVHIKTIRIGDAQQTADLQVP